MIREVDDPQLRAERTLVVMITILIVAAFVVGVVIGMLGAARKDVAEPIGCIVTTNDGPHGRACVVGDELEVLFCDDDGCASAETRGAP